jgi:hypothetical protein
MSQVCVIARVSDEIGTLIARALAKAGQVVYAGPWHAVAMSDLLRN